MVNLKVDIFTNHRTTIFELISTIFMTISSILLIIQGFENENYRNNKTRDIKTERLLFSQFSQEVYSNILSYSFSTFSNKINDYQDLTAELKFKSFFDCRGVKDLELNENICQDRINNNWTCCRAECCYRTNGGIIYCSDYNYDIRNPNSYDHKILIYDEEEYFEDPRRRLCTHYNEYYKDINTFMNQKIKIKNSPFNYEELLLNRNKSLFCLDIFNCPDYYIDCGIIDTFNRHLYAINESLCPVNNIILDNDSFILERNIDNNPNDNKIIIRNIISEIPPIAHEYKNIFVSSDIDLKHEEITIRDINKLLKNSKIIYRKLENVEIPIDSIGNDVVIENKMNKNSKFYWYTTNYIGFKTENDLLQFEKIFNKSNPYDNSLYKIGGDIYPYIKPIIILFPLLLIFIYYIIFLLLILFAKFNSTKKINRTHFIIRFIILASMFIIELIFYIMVTKEFKKIKINMDENYKEILDLYNKRRFQLKYFLSIIFLVFGLISTFLLFIANLELSQENDKIVINNINLKDEVNNEQIFKEENSPINYIDINTNQNKINNVINNENKQESDRLQLNINRIQRNENNNNLNTFNPTGIFLNNNEENNIKINNDINIFHSDNFAINDQEDQDNIINNIIDKDIKQSRNDIVKAANINYSQRINPQKIHKKININFDDNKNKDNPLFNSQNFKVQNPNKNPTLTFNDDNRNNIQTLGNSIRKKNKRVNNDIKLDNNKDEDKKSIIESNQENNVVNNKDSIKSSDNENLIDKSENITNNK